MLERNGKLQVICGSVKSGKSERLIEIIKRADIAHLPVVVFFPDVGNGRGNSYINSHDGNSW